MQSRFGGVLDGVSSDRYVYYIRDVGVFNKAILLQYQNGSRIVCILIEISLSTPECGEIAVMVMLEKWLFFLRFCEKSFARGRTFKNVQSGNGFLQRIILRKFRDPVLLAPHMDPTHSSTLASTQIWQLLSHIHFLLTNDYESAVYVGNCAHLCTGK
jgi:hypothetical protein